MSSAGGADAALCALQLQLGMDDFASERGFAAAIERAADRAIAASAGARHRLLVFPENTGLFIPLIYAPRVARRQRTLDRAMALVAASRPLRVARAMRDARTGDLRRALMLDVLPVADRLMRALFSGVARRARAYVVAGTHLRAEADAVSNTSYTFGPSGRLLATTNKVNLVPGLEDHRPGGADLARGNAAELPVVETPLGALATLICYDGFAVPHTRDEPEFVPLAGRVEALGARVIANPAANPWPWHGPWEHARPGGPQVRAQQWRREGLAAAMTEMRGVRYGVTAHLCAEILDFRFAGPSEVLARSGESERVEVLARAEDHRAEAVVVARVPSPGMTAT